MSRLAILRRSAIATMSAHQRLWSIGGPLAWFVQLCAGYALASWPCFPKDERHLTPLAGFAWTWPAMIIALTRGVVIALAAFSVSYRAFVRTQLPLPASQRHLIEVGGSRTRFLALWGMLLGAGFASRR